MAGIIRIAEFKCSHEHVTKKKLAPGEMVEPQMICPECMQENVVAPAYVIFVVGIHKVRGDGKSA